MRLDQLRDYCLAKPTAAEDQPFGPDTLVFKVGGKMFALVGLNQVPPSVALKCEPERVVELRARYAAVTPTPYMDKRLWNAVSLDGEVPDAEVRSMIDHSYDLVVAKLTRRVREELGIG